MPLLLLPLVGLGGFMLGSTTNVSFNIVLALMIAAYMAHKMGAF
ncbi:hypothetical protein [Algicola sagamiensis]|nr:hypothetical protein [Algicola sagamiensis]